MLRRLTRTGVDMKANGDVTVWLGRSSRPPQKQPPHAPARVTTVRSQASDMYMRPGGADDKWQRKRVSTRKPHDSLQPANRGFSS